MRRVRIGIRATTMLAGALIMPALGCGDAVDEQPTTATASDLYVLNTKLWPVNPVFGLRTVPVCWEQSTGFDDEKNWVRDAITETWELESQMRFLSFGTCGASSKGIRVLFQDAGGSTSGLGTSLDGLANGMKLNTWATGNGNCSTGWSRERCVRSTAVHEMGHGIGFAHEQNRPDTPTTCLPCTTNAQCTSGSTCSGGHCVQGTNGNQTVGSWDVDSVTNYCNAIRNGDGRLSGGDIYGLGEVYGHQTPIVASTWGGTTMAAFIRGPGDAIYEAFTNDGVNWSSFFTQDGVLSSAPTVASWGTDRLDLFARGTDGAVWQKYWTFAGGWQGWFSLGGSTKGKPKVIARASNRLDVFARWTDDTLRVRSWNGSAWSAWTSLGDDFVGEPSVSSWGSNRLDVVVRNRDNNLHHISWNGTSWGSWTNLGGGDLRSSPTVASWGVNRVDVVAIRSDLAVWHRSFNGTSWSGWASLGGQLFGTPRITARTANILDIFARGSDNAIWQQSWTGSGWTGWSSLGGVLKGSPEVQTPNANKVEVFAQGTDNAVWRRTWTGSWTGWIQVGGAIQ